MNKTVKKIGIILLLIILLPAIVLTTYQLNSLNEDEKIIEEIYGNQLDAILFSVNQYSEDIMSEWADQIDDLLKDYKTDKETFDEKVEEFLRIHTSVNLIFFSDIEGTENTVFPSPSIKLKKLGNYPLVKNIISSNKLKIVRLFTYKEANYRKIEPIENNFTENDVILIFLPNNEYNNKSICGIIINPNLFTEQVLSPKIQAIAQNEIVISIFDEVKDTVLYQNERIPAEIIKHRRELWLIPGGTIGIYLKGSSLESLVSERAFSFVIIITLLTIVLIVGVWFVFSNIRKEIKLAQIKSDFVSNVSHELRTPLALISMFAETLEMERASSEEKKKEYYKIISQETNRLGRIVNTILNFSKMEAGKRKFNFVETDLNSLIDKVLTTYQFHLQNKGFNLSIKKSESIPQIYADEEAISEALINLVDNAIKYSKENKKILISTGTNGQFSFVEVEDQGVGISEDEQKKIFDKFYRVSTGLVHNIKGTGLGLTLVRQIIEAHKGTIELESKLGKGSRFKLNLPIHSKKTE